MPELKPCPFCGQKAHFVYVEKYGTPCIVAQCTHCLSRSDVSVLFEYQGLSPVLDVAADFWNFRAELLNDGDNSTDQ